MKLGDHFPLHIRESTTEHRLVPGAVLYLPFIFPGESKPKDKYMVVVAAVSPRLLLMVINTDINQLVARTPALHCCNIEIHQSDHPFLDYDSNLSCHQVQLANAAVTAKLISEETMRYKGRISNEMRMEILKVVATEPQSISKFNRNAITAALQTPFTD